MRIANDFLYRAERSGCIRVNLFVKQVAPAVILIGYGSVIAVAGTIIEILPYKLVGRVIHIRILFGSVGKCYASAPYLRYVAVSVSSMSLLKLRFISLRYR